ncbi:MAG TPA: serine protease [Nitrososphaera sp.]|nr:serine protease [Nitrososphaera sp.]
MFDELVLKNVKDATVALGLVEKGSAKPLKICGSGFLIDPNGYIMTAGHVSDAIRGWINYYKEQKIELERAAFMLDPHGDRVDFVTAELDERVARFHPVQKPKGYTMADDIDIAVCKIIAKVSNLPRLRIRNSDVVLYEEVAMCGYPRGSQSLNLSTAYIGIRLSPVMQFGRVVSLFLVDSAPAPNGFQTDIVGTGGSSGSAIVDLKGNVVGIALEVFGADIMKLPKNESTLYIAKVGLVYGLTTNMLNVIFNNVADFFERNIKNIPYPFDTTTIYPTNFRRL